MGWQILAARVAASWHLALGKASLKELSAIETHPVLRDVWFGMSCSVIITQTQTSTTCNLGLSLVL